MAKKLKKINELDFLNDYENNNISIRTLCKVYGISSTRGSGILKRLGSEKYFENYQKYGSKPWNKGLDKSDSRVAAYSRKLSDVRIKTGRRSGYKTVYVDELEKRVKAHDYVWFKNYGSWPDGKNGEQIHHIDGDKDNNHINNLVLTDVSEHSKIHKEYELVYLKLLKMGLLKFDIEKRGVDWNSFTEMVKKLNQ